jgi:hypothetical protein
MDDWFLLTHFLKWVYSYFWLKYTRERAIKALSLS